MIVQKFIDDDSVYINNVEFLDNGSAVFFSYSVTDDIVFNFTSSYFETFQADAGELLKVLPQEDTNHTLEDIGWKIGYDDDEETLYYKDTRYIDIAHGHVEISNHYGHGPEPCILTRDEMLALRKLLA